MDRLSDLRSTGVRFRQRELPAAAAAEFVTAGIAAKSQFEVAATVLGELCASRRLV